MKEALWTTCSWDVTRRIPSVSIDEGRMKKEASESVQKARNYRKSDTADEENVSIAASDV